MISVVLVEILRVSGSKIINNLGAFGSKSVQRSVFCLHLATLRAAKIEQLAATALALSGSP
jgi:hypothetical protein